MTVALATVLELEGGRALRGRLRMPGDKSISHRALLLGARADGTSVIRGLADGDDVSRTRAAIQSLGALVESERITGGRARLTEAKTVIDVGNSGTTIRLLAGFCAAFPWLTVLWGDRSVARRPMDRVATPLRAMGATVDARHGGRYPPLVIRGGQLRGIDYTLPVASAQVKSAILLAGLDADGDTIVREPVPTRSHTEEMLLACGADLVMDDDARLGRVVRLRRSSLRPFELDVPGDPSQAAFWVVAACLVPGSDLVVEDVYVGRARTGFIDVLIRMGADVEVRPRGDGEKAKAKATAVTADIRARHSALKGTEVGGAEVAALVDEIPVLAVAAATAEGVTTFRDAGELLVKESNRVATITSELGVLGARVEPRADGLVVVGNGAGRLRGGTVRSHGDHRVAMAMAVAALAAEGSTRIEGWDAVGKSYPSFERDLERCGS